MSKTKLKNEKALIKEALRLGEAYGVKRGVVKFEAHDSMDVKLEYIYRLLVHDKKIQPLPQVDISIGKIKTRLARWALAELPDDHELK